MGDAGGFGAAPADDACPAQRRAGAQRHARGRAADGVDVGIVVEVALHLRAYALAGHAGDCADELLGLGVEAPAVVGAAAGTLMAANLHQLAARTHRVSQGRRARREIDRHAY